MKFTDLYYELHTWCSRSFLIGTRPSQNSQGNIGSEAPARLFWLLLEAVEDTLLTFLSFSPLWVLPRIHEKYILRAMPTFLHTYRKVASSRLSWLVAHLRIFRVFMKGKVDAYVLWPLAKRVQNWIVDHSTARDFTAYKIQHLHDYMHVLKMV